jgi:electron transfer flavoprotein alpha subunit
VSAVVAGDDVRSAALELLSYGVDKAYTYEHEAFKYFKADLYTNVLADVAGHARPSVVLTGATSIGRSLAPRVSTRLRTGITADCTSLDITEDEDLIQIRPAFGGNIMAEIITPRSRPQFATVRYKVMDRAVIQKPHGEIVDMPIDEKLLKTGIEVISVNKKPPSENISDAEILVVGGKGLKSPADLELIKGLAEKLGGQYAVTRPVVEAGWALQTRQIGLSGRTVKPKLLMAFGVSGAVQFTAAMKNSECIFAVNNDRNAPIMDIAHYGVVGDLYEIIPLLLEA